jgi:hypothetical protein
MGAVRPVIGPSMNWRAQASACSCWAWCALLTGAQARWHGCPPKAEQRIYFANHQSHADLVLIWAALPRSCAASPGPSPPRTTGPRLRFKRWITTEVFNAVYVERERKGDEDPLQPLIDALASGDSLILFPEGTRGHAEDPQPSSRAVQPGPRFPTWCWCRPGSTTCSASCPRARWCRCRCCARSPSASRCALGPTRTAPISCAARARP